MSVQFQVVQLPSGHHLCKVRALNRGDANSEVTVYYQVGGPLHTAILMAKCLLGTKIWGISDPMTFTAHCGYLCICAWGHLSC